VLNEAKAVGESGLRNRRREERGQLRAREVDRKMWYAPIECQQPTIDRGQGEDGGEEGGGTLDRLEIPLPSVNGKGTRWERVGVEDMNLRSPAQSSKSRPKCGGGAAKQKKNRGRIRPDDWGVAPSLYCLTARPHFRPRPDC
jgi:hypothetical protein